MGDRERARERERTREREGVRDRERARERERERARERESERERARGLDPRLCGGPGARRARSTRGPLWGYLKSQFSRDLVKFWQ